MKRVGLFPMVSMVALTACATLASEGRGDVDLPNVLSGPFRALKHGQTCDGDVCTGVDELPPGTPNGVVKYPGSPASRSPSVLVRGAGGDDLRVVLYVGRGVAGTPEDRISRMEAPDARTFTDVVDVLHADQPWEKGAMSDPAALEVNGEVWIYYEVHGVGVGRARSSDGLTGRAFTKDPGPLAIDGAAGAWETEPPRAPSVVRLDDGSFHLFYASGKAIGEATSSDGLHFTRAGTTPIVTASAAVDIASLPPGVRPPFDDDSVDDPTVDRIVTVTGRTLYRMLYTGRDLRGGSSVGYAGRFGDAGTFEKQEGFVFGGKLPGSATSNSHANAPAVARFADMALVFANVDSDKEQKIGIGIAPQTKTLPIGE